MNNPSSCDLLRGHLFQIHCPTVEEQVKPCFIKSYSCAVAEGPPKLPMQDQIHLHKVLQHKDHLEFSVFAFKRRLENVHESLVRTKQEIQIGLEDQAALQSCLEKAEDGSTIAAISVQKAEKHNKLMELLGQEDSLLNELEATRKSLSLANIEQQSFALEMHHRIDEIYRIHTTRKEFEFQCRLQREEAIRRNGIKSRQRELAQCAAAEEEYHNRVMDSLIEKPKVRKESLQKLRSRRNKTLAEIAAQKKREQADAELRRIQQKNNVVVLKRELDEQREMLAAATRLREERSSEKAKALETKRREIIAAGGDPFALERSALKAKAKRTAENEQQEARDALMNRLAKVIKQQEDADQRKLKLRQELDQIWETKAKQKRLQAKARENQHFEQLLESRARLFTEEPNHTSLVDDDIQQEAFKFDVIVDDSAVPPNEINASGDAKIVKGVREPSSPKSTTAFKAIPDEVIFKDFEIGKVYRRKVAISNRSDTRARFYLKEFVDLGQSQDDGERTLISNVVNVTFDPPPPLSPGLTHEFYLTFAPKTFESWKGELQFESALGLFAVPVKCLMKAFQPALNTEWITFSNVIVGTTVTGMVKMTNRGSLPGLVTTIEPVDPAECRQLEEVDVCTELPSANENRRRKHLQMKICEEAGESEEVGVPAIDEEQVESTRIMDVFNVTLDNDVGQLAANGELTLNVMFSPMMTGNHSLFYKIAFDNPDICSLKLFVEGTAIPSPFVAEPLNVNLNICQMNFKYQQPIEVRNLSKSRGKIVSKVPTVLKPFVEVVPKTTISFPGTATLFSVKFNPRLDLLDHLSVQQVFDVNTRILDFPVLFFFENFPFTTPGPLECTFQAILDQPSLSVDPTEIDFGTCSTSETVHRTVQIRGVGAVAQDFGFVDMPDWIAVQPNYGFGTVLPGETCDLEVLLSLPPTLVGKQTATLKVRTLARKDTVINIKATGKVNKTVLKYSQISFPVTCVDSTVSTVTEIYFKGAKSKYGSAPMQRSTRFPPPVGTTATFEFLVDANFPIEITPSAGSFKAGKSQTVLVTFKANLRPDSVFAYYPEMLQQKFNVNRENIALEQTRIAEMLTNIGRRASNSSTLKGSGDPPTQQRDRRTTKAKSNSGRKSSRASSDVSGGKSPKRKGSGSRSSKVLEPPVISNLDDLQVLFSHGQVSIRRTDHKELELRHNFLSYALAATLVPGPAPEIGSTDYVKIRRQLLKEMSLHCDTFTVPCRVTLDDGTEELHLLTLKCPFQKPDLVILDDPPEVYFGSVTIGNSAIQELNLHNTSVGLLTLKMDTVHPFGPFTQVNALRPLAPNLVFTLRVKFAPKTEGKFEESVVISGGDSRILVKFKGTGIPALDNAEPSA